MAVQIRCCYVSTDVTFHCIDVNHCVLWKKTPKSGKVVIYGGRSAVDGGGCVCYSKNDNHIRGRRPWAVMEPIFSVSETSDSASEQLMTMFYAMVLFCSILVILICHNPLLESTYYFLI